MVTEYEKLMIEDIDETTNEIMDMIRQEFKLNEDSDKDDEVYGFIHNKLKELKMKTHKKLDELYKELETAQDIVAEYTEKELVLAEIKGFIEGEGIK